MKYETWIECDSGSDEIWRGGCTPEGIACANVYTAIEQMDNYASGSNNLGQLIRLAHGRVRSEWPVSTREPVIDFELSSIVVSHGWEVVTLRELGEEQKRELKTAADKLEFVKEAFGITVSQLAKILDRSRQSVHSWLGGEEPKSDSVLEKIHKLDEIAQKWCELNIYHFSPGAIFRQPIGARPSMLEQLSNENLDEEEIYRSLNLMLELMGKRRARMDRSKEKAGNSSLSTEEKALRRKALTRSVGPKD